MKYVLVFLGIILLTLLISRYVSTSIPVRTDLVPKATVTLPTVVTPKDTPQTSGYAEIRGTATIDRTSGPPGVPYIAYRQDDGTLATKQLVFADARGCHPGAGDLPCSPTSAMSAYPTLEEGQALFVQGYIRADRFLVTSITTP